MITSTHQIVKYDFDPQGEYQISVKKNDRVYVDLQSNGWFKGFVTNDSSRFGIFPATYVDLEDNAAAFHRQASSDTANNTPSGSGSAFENSTVKPTPASRKPPTRAGPTQAFNPNASNSSGTTTAPAGRRPPPLPASRAPPPKPGSRGPPPRPGTRGPPPLPSGGSGTSSGSLEDDEEEVKVREKLPPVAPPANKAEPMLDEALRTEIGTCIHEWTEQLAKHGAAGAASDYHMVKERMFTLLELRNKILREKDATRKTSLREEIIRLVENSRKLQEGFMIPRNQQGALADASNTGVMELLELHRSMYKTIKEESDISFAQNNLRRRQASVASQKLGGSKFPAGPLQLYLNVKMCILSVGENIEVVFQVYSGARKQFITEPYTVLMTGMGMPANLAMLNKLRAIFQDLDASDFNGKLYLVAQIYRRGALVFDPKKKMSGMAKPGGPDYRRPFGCSVVDLSSLGKKEAGQLMQSVNLTVQNGEPQETQMQIYTPRDGSESSFSKLHTMIIDNNKTLDIPAQTKGIAVEISLISGTTEHAQQVVVNHYASEHKGDPILPKEIAFTRKTEFPDTLDVAEVRNDFYLYLLNGKFSQDNKTSAKNIQIVVSVFDQDGNIVRDSILYNSLDRNKDEGKGVEDYKSGVYYHMNDPTFNETLLLKIDPSLFEWCHVLFTVWHVSTSTKKSAPFSYGWLKLTTDTGAVIPDDEYVIRTYKPWAKMGESGVRNPVMYLKSDPASLGPRKDTEMLRVATRLCSTKLTQNDTLHSLFRWRKLDVQALRLRLKEFLKINRGGLNELAKFVREMFDMFFDILRSENHSMLYGEVFTAFVHALGLLTDKKIQQFRPLVDSYINNIYAQPSVHSTLLQKCQEKFDECKDDPDQFVMQLCKSLNYIIKFVVASRKLDMQQDSPSCDQATFKASLLKMLASVNRISALMPSDARYLFSSQSYILRGFHEIVEDLKDMFEDQELGALGKSVIESVAAADRHTINKLNLIRLLLCGRVGERTAARNVIAPVVLSNMKAHMLSISDRALTKPYLCIAIVQKFLQIAEKDDTVAGHINSDEMWSFTSVLPSIVEAIYLIQENADGRRKLNPPSETVIQYCKLDLLLDGHTTLWSVIHNMSSEQLDRYFASLEAEECAQFLSRLLEVCTNAPRVLTVPDQWVSFGMLQLSVMHKVLERVAVSLKGAFSASSDGFNARVWRKWFQLTLTLLNNPDLELEHFNESKSKFVVARYGDMRLKVLELTRELWAALDTKKVLFVGVLLTDIFSLAQHRFEAAVVFAFDLYYDMLCSEFTNTAEFNEVERHTIDDLYKLAGNSVSDAFVERLFAETRSRMESQNRLGAEGNKVLESFLTHLSTMYELMSSLLRFPNTAVFEDERTATALKLMKYLEETGHVRKEMSSRYVQILVDLHVGLGNYIEAGIAQLYQIRLLEWTNAMLIQSPDGNFPPEPERCRRERLYKKAIEYFLQGEDWERALELGNQLRFYYENISFEYEKLADLLREQAENYQYIRFQSRYFYSYFRVVFYGDFPQDIAGKEFVYRGGKLEQVREFMERMRAKYDDAYILMSSDAPNQEMYAKHPKMISITNLQIEDEASDEYRAELMGGASTATPKDLFQPIEESDIPENIVSYHRNRDLCVFSYSKPDNRSPEKKPKNEFKDMWIKQTLVYVEEQFPTNRRRVEIVNKEVRAIEPIRNAIDSIVAKNAELRLKIVSVEMDDNHDVGPLSMNLNGMIDAAVNGGTDKYVEAFLCEGYMSDGNDPQVTKDLQFELTQSMLDQVEILRDGLRIFESYGGEALKGLVDHLTTSFKKMEEKTRALRANQ